MRRQWQIWSADPSRNHSGGRCCPGCGQAGTRVTLDDGTTIEVVDVRSVDDRTVLDLAVRAAGLTVWLPTRAA